MKQGAVVHSPPRPSCRAAVVYAPVGGERIDKEQSEASALVRIGSRSRQPGGVNVGQLDSDDAQTLVVGKKRG